jgi:hypothetical protein
VTPMAAAGERLRQASGLAPVLGAAHEAFEAMLAAIRSHEDPTTGLFSAFIMAAALAADGRDAIAFAPSMPPVGSRDLLDDEADARVPPESVARLVSDLSQLVRAQLTRSAGQATDPADQDACDQAARCAAGIHDLLARGGP